MKPGLQLYPKLIISFILLCVTCTLSISLYASDAPLQKQTAQVASERSIAGPPLTIIADNRSSTFKVPPPAFALRNDSAGQMSALTANLVVNYNPPTCTGSVSAWPANAQSAFSFAANIWAGLINSSQTIVINACWRSDLGANVLGSAGATTIHRDFTNAPFAGTWYPVGLANALANSDLNGTDAEIGANFNSNFSNWYFGTDGNTPVNQYDFATVVLHELGHGLGFFGSMSISGGQGQWGFGTSFPAIYDRFAEDGNGMSLLNYTNGSTSLANVLMGNANGVFFDGTSANAANSGNRVKLYSPSTWSQGSSYSHLDEIFNNTPHALMTFSLAQGESIQDPNQVTLCMFKDMGWGANCSPPPTTGTIKLVKNTVNNNGTFNFSSPDAALDAVSITTSGNTGQSSTLTKNAASYQVTEDSQANWALTALACTGDTDNGSTVELANRRVTIDLDAGENIICTFTNTFTAPPTTGTIKLVKNTVNNNGTFNFSSPDAALDAVSITTSGNTGQSSTLTKNAASYQVTEDNQANWALTALACTGDNDNGSTVDLANRRVTIDLDAGENIVCTFTNTFTAPPTTGTIKLVKNTVNNNGTFNYSSPDAALDAISITTSGNTGQSSTLTKNAGSYQVTEESQANWALTALTCTGDTDNGSTVDLANRRVTIDLDAGENIVCTFTNTFTAPPTNGTIKLVKNTVNNNGTFNFSSPDADLDAISITTSGNTGQSSTLTKNAASYQVTEESQANWALTALACTGDNDNGSTVELANRRVTIDLDAGENIVCTFTNTFTAPPTSANLAITKTDAADPVNQGGQITYNIVVNNAGPDSATNVVIADTLPAGVAFVSAATTQGTCSQSGGIVQCTLGTVPNGSSVQVTIVVNALTAGTVSNTATVSASTPDPNLTNNSDSETTIVNVNTATCVQFSINLNGRKEVPANPSTARGAASVRVNTTTNTLTYFISYTGLSSRETGAHIHGFAAAGNNAGVLHTLPFGPSKSGTWTYAEAQEANILTGLTYLNIHSQRYPNGEIRGQIANGVTCTTAALAAEVPELLTSEEEAEFTTFLPLIER